MILLTAWVAMALSAQPAGTPPSQVLAEGRWEPEVRAHLEQLLVERGATSPEYDPAAPPVAVFDWDNTCIRGDIEETTLAILDHRDGGERIATYERMCEEEGIIACYTWAAVEVVRGLTEGEARALAHEAIALGLADERLSLRPEVRDLVWAMQRHGWDVWVVSAAAYPLVQAFAQRYGVAPDHVVGVHVARDDHGVFTDHLAEPLTYRQGKVEAIERHVGRPPVFAAGDTWTDLEMLQAAPHVLFMDRGEPRLLEIAREAGWWVQPAF